MSEIVECLEGTKRIDTLLHQVLQNITPDAATKEILALLRAGATKPGRASKLQVTYILERCAEAIHDIRDVCIDAQTETRLNAVMDVIDEGLGTAASLVDPSSDGKWLGKFDQTCVTHRIAGPKPKMSKLILLPE